MAETTKSSVSDSAASNAAARYRALAPRAPEQGLDLFEFFPKGAEIELEIGFGRGMFLIQRAQAAPASYLLGIEIKDKLAVRVAERLARRGIPNARVLAGDARAIARGLRPDAALARAFMHFPDPWWKKRHAKRRLLDTTLLDELSRLIRPGGELFVQTDVEQRSELFLKEIDAHPGFEIAGGGYLDHNPFGAVSNRELRAEQDGLPIYRILSTRRAAHSAR